MAERTITAEILKPCVLCCLPGSIVEVTETQFRCLGDAARALDNDAPLPYKIVDMSTMETESGETAPESVEKSVETVENAPETPEASEAPETPEASLTPETPEKKTGRRKQKE